jgi:hypothetical protein
VIMASHSVGSQALRGQRLDIRGGRAAAARGVA